MIDNKEMMQITQDRYYKFIRMYLLANPMH